jgi:hypothetical protein
MLDQDPHDPLQATLALLHSAPQSAAALTLYALVCTLEKQRAGCLFTLTKLQDLTDPVHRRIAYGLMELLATGRVGDGNWYAVKAEMDQAIRGA